MVRRGSPVRVRKGPQSTSAFAPIRGSFGGLLHAGGEDVGKIRLGLTAESYAFPISSLAHSGRGRCRRTLSLRPPCWSLNRTKKSRRVSYTSSKSCGSNASGSPIPPMPFPLPVHPEDGLSFLPGASLPWFLFEGLHRTSDGEEVGAGDHPSPPSGMDVRSALWSTLRRRTTRGGMPL